jgi:hypothetical protein
MRTWENPKLGGQLFLGENYAKSNILFLGLNPGLWRFGSERRNYVLENFGSMPFWTDLLHKNVLIDTTEGDFVFWKNCSTFFNFIPETKKKMELATFSFSVPWRTRNNDELDAFFARTPKAKEFSKEILNKIFEDCNPQFIFISGKGNAERIRITRKTWGVV